MGEGAGGTLRGRCRPHQAPPMGRQSACQALSRLVGQWQRFHRAHSRGCQVAGCKATRKKRES
eukprot:366000-Chlamydomonas_euryale.AAC.42